MRRILLCLVVFFVPTAVFADGWVAQMEEDEGGPVMMASVTAPSNGDLAPALEMTCADEGVSLRYLMAVDTGQPGSEADFVFTSSGTQAKLHMAYEDMDGAFAAYFPKSDPVVALLQTGSDVLVAGTSGSFPSQTFTLKGSSRAISTLFKTCN